MATVEHVLAAAKKAGLWAGIHTGAPAYARRMHELGFDFVSLASDSRLLALKSQESLAEIEEPPHRKDRHEPTDQRWKRTSWSSGNGPTAV